MKAMLTIDVNSFDFSFISYDSLDDILASESVQKLYDTEIDLKSHFFLISKPS